MADGILSSCNFMHLRCVIEHTRLPCGRAFAYPVVVTALCCIGDACTTFAGPAFALSSAMSNKGKEARQAEDGQRSNGK
jgi:hypothetical protein